MKMMDPFKFTWKMCKYASLWYVFQKYGKQNNGASFINSSDLKKYVNSHNKGLLVDGVNKRLSVKDSFTHLLLIAKTGRGKTSKYVIPNILDKANQNCSFIINDPSNDIYSKTSEILKKMGLISLLLTLKIVDTHLVLTLFLMSEILLISIHYPSFWCLLAYLTREISGVVLQKGLYQ